MIPVLSRKGWAALVGVLFLCGVSVAIYRWRVKERQSPKFTISAETTYITGPLRADGYVDYETALNERLAKGITPENNAQVLLLKATGPHVESRSLPPAYFLWLGIEAPPEKGEYFIDFFRYVTKHLQLEADALREGLIAVQEKRAERPWTAKECPDVAEWLAVNEKPLTLAVEAAKRPSFYCPLVTVKGTGALYGALPAVQQAREIAQGLKSRALLHTGEGRFDEAWQDLLACHRLGRLVARGGTLIEWLVGIAIEAVASNADLLFLDRAELSAKQLRDCLNDLQQLAPLPSLADKYDLAERFIALDLMRQIQIDPTDVLKGLLLFQNDVKLTREDLNGIDWNKVLRSLNQTFDQIDKTLRIQDRTARELQLDQLEKEHKAMLGARDDEPDEQGSSLSKIGKNLVSLLRRDRSRTDAEKTLINLCSSCTIAHNLQRTADRAEQTQRNLQVAFALAAYRRDNGRYPLELNQLTPKYLAQVPGDLFSGKALIYRPEADAYLLYSVGINGQDDGGQLIGDDPRGDDVGVRMPIPALNPNP